MGDIKLKLEAANQNKTEKDLNKQEKQTRFTQMDLSDNELKLTELGD